MIDTGGKALKVEIIKGAYSQLRISGITRQPTPDDLEIALNRLESMVSEWDDIRNVNINYNFEDNPDPNSLLGVKRSFWQALETNLAVRLMPDFGKGKAPDVSLLAQANQSFSALSGSVALNKLAQIQYPSRMGVGSGNTLRSTRWSRFYSVTPDAPNISGTVIMIQGDVQDFIEHFDSYLKDGETIKSFDIIAEPALKIISSSKTDIDVNYRIKALAGNSISTQNNQQLTVVVTTSTDRVVSRVRFFNVQPKQGKL